MWVRVNTMATKFNSLLTDDKYQITKSDSECFFQIEFLPTTSVTLSFKWHVNDKGYVYGM